MLLFRCPGVARAVFSRCPYERFAAWFGMKKLVSGPAIIIPSNFPRTRRGPDSRGIRLCFQELGRSCSLQQGFLTFTDGSAYSYDAPSLDEVVALVVQLQRGRVFNLFTRRSRTGFVRGFTPPADYETIYSFPPYEGTAPAACPLPGVPWDQLSWSRTVFVPGSVFPWTFNPLTGMAALQNQQLSCFPDSAGANATTVATLSFTGGATPSTFEIQAGDVFGVITWQAVIDVSVNGSSVYNSTFLQTGSFAEIDPFTVPDSLGVPESIVCTVQLSLISIVSPDAISFNFGFANA